MSSNDLALVLFNHFKDKNHKSDNLSLHLNIEAQTQDFIYNLQNSDLIEVANCIKSL